MFENITYTFGESEFFAIIVIVFAVGVIQSSMTGASILRRFDRRRRKRIKYIAIFIAILFTVYAFTNINKFTSTSDLPEITTNIPTNFGELEKIGQDLIHLDLDLWGIISIAIPAIVFLFGRIGRMSRARKRFLMVVGIGAFAVMTFVTVTDYVPSPTVINMYISYQVGIVFGGVLSSGILRYV